MVQDGIVRLFMALQVLDGKNVYSNLTRKNEFSTKIHKKKLHVFVKPVKLFRQPYLYFMKSARNTFTV